MQTGQALPTTTDVRRLAGALISDELVIIPVRHHSPACADTVGRAFDEYAPSRVLIEGPHSFNPLVKLLAHPEAVFPLAVYAYARRPAKKGEPPQPGTSGYYPFCDYSPELVALRRGVAAEIPVEFCDLDLAEQWLLELSHPDPDTPRSLLDEKAYSHSASLDRLAAQLGCRDHEDLWELLFESDARPPDLTEQLARTTAYCLLARRDRTPAELAADTTLAREAEMAWHVRQAVLKRDDGDGPVLLVVGGFHAVVMPDLIAAPPDRPATHTDHIESGHALIRYGFDRLDRLNGYASGMTAPEWHQRIWDARQNGTSPAAARGSVALTTLLDIAGVMRDKHNTPVATPTLAAAYQQATLLADLRGRAAPLRSDVLDAVVSCLVQGDADTDGALVQSVTRAVLTGVRVGTVPPGAGTPPLVADTLQRLRAQRLKVDDIGAYTAALDLYRNPAHRRASRLLHGLQLLMVPFASWQAGPDFINGLGLSRLQERWSYEWTPASVGALVELSQLGPTLPDAVAARFAEMLNLLTADGRIPGSDEASAALARAAVLGLHSQAHDVVRLVQSALAAEAAFPAVVTATSRLALLSEGREPLEASQLTDLPALVQAGYARALYLGSGLRGQEAPPADIVTALAQLRELLAGGAHDLDPDPYWAMLHKLRVEHDVAHVRGAAAGLAFAAGRLPGPDLARDVAGHLSGTIPPAEAVGFLRGLLSVAREALWQDVGLVPALDAQLSGWDQAMFLQHLPELRLAFASLNPRETDRVAALVAGHLGLSGTGLGPLMTRDVTEDDMQRNLQLSEEAAQLLRGDGLGDWLATP